MKTYDLLIVGNSAAAIGAIEYFRRYDQRCSVGIISEEAAPSYSKHLISYFLSGEKDLEDILYRPRDFYLRHKVEPILGVRVEEIDYDAKTVSLGNGSSTAYRKLLLAVGGRPVVPPIPNRDLEGVFTFTRLEEAKNLKEYVRERSRVVVIGGGLIGLQVAEALRKLSCEVTVIELMDRILKPVLDAETSRTVEEIVESNGVRVKTSTAAKEILPAKDDPAKAGGVLTAEGEEIPADVVVLSVGVVPRTELAKDRLQINRGIVVDDNLMTSESGVYAAGDVAEAKEFISGQRKCLPIWPVAYEQGKVAGKNLAGRKEAYRGGLSMNAAHFFGWSVASAGIHDPSPEDGCEVLIDKSKEEYKKLVLKDGVLVGFIAGGQAVDRSGILLGLIKSRAKVEGYAGELLKRNALAALPDDIRRARLMGRETA